MTLKLMNPVEIAQVVSTSGWTAWELVAVTGALLAEHGTQYDHPPGGLPPGFYGDAYAIYVNHDESVDIGLFSLNTVWIPEPTLAERLDPPAAAAWARLYWLRWFKRPEVKALPDYQARLAYVLPRMWHAVDTDRYPDCRRRAIDAAKQIGAI